MRRTDWKDIAELIGIAAIVASLVFVGFQLNQDRSLMHAQILSEQDDTQIEWARLLNDNHDLWVKALDGEKLDKNSTARFEAIAGAFFTKRSLLFQRMSRVGNIPPDLVASQTAVIIASHIGLRPVWNKRYSWWEQLDYVPVFDGAVQQYLDEIDRGDRELIKYDSYWIF